MLSKKNTIAHCSWLNKLCNIKNDSFTGYLMYAVKTMQLFYIWLLHFFSIPKIYFRLSWKTWKALFIELVSLFFCIYFLLLLVIWLAVEKMFSTEPIDAFLDLCLSYIFLVAFVS